MSEDMDEVKGCDSIAQKMNIGSGYELKVHKNKEVMMQAMNKYKIMNQNNWLINLNMNSEEPNQFKQIQINYFLSLQDNVQIPNNEETKNNG